MIIVNKKYLYLMIVPLMLFSDNTYAFSMKQLWKDKIEKRPVSELKAIDINKNGIKELVVISNYTSPLEKYALEYGTYGYIKLYEWNGSSLIKKWENPEITKRISASVIKSGDQETLQIGTFSLNILLYKDKKYILEQREKSLRLLWLDDALAVGSFTRKGNKDIIVTGYYEDTIATRNYHVQFRDGKNPSNIVWTSPILKKGSGWGIFGDFNMDGKIELLLAAGYWIYPTENNYKIVEIESHRKSKYGTTMPLFDIISPMPGVKYFESGRTINKDFDDVFYLEPSPYPYDYGDYLIKATWKKDRFEYEKILSAKKTTKSGEFIVFKNFKLVDLDDDGLDEIIVTEASGKFVPTEEEPGITDYKEKILMLKWNGKKYETVFASQKLKGNISMLIDDITGDGKKEIVIGNEKGEIYIFGQK